MSLRGWFDSTPPHMDTTITTSVINGPADVICDVRFETCPTTTTVVYDIGTPPVMPKTGQMSMPIGVIGMLFVAVGMLMARIARRA